ncbi:MAG TPA: YndJ family transporter [Candidatus Acidoferrum sp.]|nr:YndJ family transporter [Candidatus Acidoferrum sp.]
MPTGQTLFPPGATMAIGGGLIWLSPLFRTIQQSRFSVFELLFLLVPLVVFPLTLNLIPVTGNSWLTRFVRGVVLYCFLPAAMLVVASFRPGGVRPIAGAATFPWLLIAVALAFDGLRRLVQTRCRSFPEFCFAFGEGYAMVGALWLTASRLGLRPAGFHEPIVLLTAIHFHYAGLMTAVLAGLAASSIRTPLSIRLALSCAVIGPGLLGLAFLAGPKLKLAAVGLMVIGECAIAFATFRIGLAEAGGTGGRMLLVGSACMIVGIALAGIWAVGEYPLHAFVNLGQMARYHGVLNSLGFGLCSLVGWNLLQRRRMPEEPR